MYQVRIADSYTGERIVIHDFRAEELVLIEPTLEMELDYSGSFMFGMHNFHPHFSKMQVLKTIVEVAFNDEVVWQGRILSTHDDFINFRKFKCEGILAALNDTIQPQREMHDISVRDFINTIIQYHNSNSHWKFNIGRVDSDKKLYRFTNHENTMECFRNKLLNRKVGHLMVDYSVSGPPTIKFVNRGNERPDQFIMFGENLLDCAKEIDGSEFFTQIIPLGSNLENPTIKVLGERVSVKSVNGGSEIVRGPNPLGLSPITKVVIWENVTVPSTLLKRAQDYLNNAVPNIRVEIKAIDAGLIYDFIQPLRVGDIVKATSKVHDLEQEFMVTKLEIPLDEPQQTNITLGMSLANSLSHILANGGKE